MFEDLFEKHSTQYEFVSQEMLYEMYAAISEDIEQGKQDRGVWAKAFVDAKGNEQEAKALYIELMVQRLLLAMDAKKETSENETRIEQRRQTKKKMEQRINSSVTKAKDFFEQEDLSVVDTIPGAIIALTLLVGAGYVSYFFYQFAGFGYTWFIGSFISLGLVGLALQVMDYIYKFLKK